MSIVSEIRKSVREKADSPEPAPALLVVFRTADAVLSAVRRLRREGVRRIDVHSPHPIHGLDDALGTRTGAVLPMGAMLGAGIGLAGGLWMAWWMNAVDYPFLISGKPLFSVVPSLPVAFELAILLAAFAVFGGALVLGGLPAFADAKFRIPAFGRATNDRYVVAVSENEARFASADLCDLLKDLGAVQIEHVPLISDHERKIPRTLVLMAVSLGALALVPPVLIAKARATTSSQPRISLISDMDHQPKFKAQSTTTLFPDGRSARPQVAGTVARGDLQQDVELYRGRGPDADWVTSFPLEIDQSTLVRGQRRYEIFCATCHGLGGDGDGLVTQRALELEQGTWVKPTSLHSEAIRTQPVGQLFNTISNGIRKMPGYASQIPVQDRWRIVAYLRALQRTRTATLEDVPRDVVPNLRELK